MRPKLKASFYSGPSTYDPFIFENILFVKAVYKDKTLGRGIKFSGEPDADQVELAWDRVCELFPDEVSDAN